MNHWVAKYIAIGCAIGITGVVVLSQMPQCTSEVFNLDEWSKGVIESFNEVIKPLDIQVGLEESYWKPKLTSLNNGNNQLSSWKELRNVCASGFADLYKDKDKRIEVLNNLENNWPDRTNYENINYTHCLDKTKA